MPYFYLYFIVCLALTVILSFIGQVLPTISADLKKVSPYECGFDPINSARLPFSFRFFLVAILFLIFDLEIAILLALPIATPLYKRFLGIIPLLSFLLILIIGLWYEWAQGGLDWAEDEVLILKKDEAL